MSDAEQSHPNWCFRAETARLLALNVAQIHTGLNEGDASIDTLTQSFQKLANFCADLSTMQPTASSIEQLSSIAQQMTEEVNEAIIAFQFYDRLCQRLGHVQENLFLLSELITDEDHINSAAGWQTLRTKIKASYTMELEHTVYEAVMDGATIEQALELYKKAFNQHQQEDDIELF